MMLGRKTNLALVGFLIFLNITIRYFLVGNHEEGSDSFLIHSLANSISTFGTAKWIVHPLSYFGLTPLSYPCAVPYLLSGISQLCGVSMETSVLYLSFTTGLIGLGSAYLMAMEIKRDHLFAFIVAFVFSLAPIFVEYSLWQATTRSLFMAFLPLLVWSLMRTFGDRPNNATNVFLCILLFTVLGTIHHMFLLLPLFLIAYFSSQFIYYWIRKKGVKDHWMYRYQTWILAVIIVLVFVPQFTQMSIYSSLSWKRYETGLFFNGPERHIILLNLLVDYWSRTGFFAFFGIFGLMLLIYHPRKKVVDILKRYSFEKNRREIFLIMCLICTIPFATMGVYVSLIFLPFFCVIIGYFFIWLFKYLRRNKNLARAFFILFILISLSFTVFMNMHWNQTQTSQPMSEHTYSTSIYLSENFENTSLSNNGLFSNRITSISKSPCLPLGGANVLAYPPELLIYNFANIEDYTFSRLSFDSVILTQSDYLYTTDFGVNAKEDWINIMASSVNDKRSEQLINRYHIEQAIEYIPHEKQYFFWVIRDSIFFLSMDMNKYELYNNGEHRIWLL